jgi:hypothetical protein
MRAFSARANRSAAFVLFCPVTVVASPILRRINIIAVTTRNNLICVVNDGDDGASKNRSERLVWINTIRSLHKSKE